MNGQLSEHPLGELLHEISDARLSGALRLGHERVKGAVYFDAGRVVAALTNLRAYRLGELLRHALASAAERLGEVISEGMSDEEVAAAVVRAGVLDADELARWRERQSTEVLRALLRRAEGEWSFDPRVRLAGEARAGLNLPPLLVESARLLTPEAAARRMSDADDVLSPATDAPGFDSEGGVQLLPTEAFVLSRVGGPTRLSELVAVSGLPEAETLAAAYTLALGGLLRRERWPRALAPELLRAAAAPRPAAPPPPPEPVAASPPAPPPPAPEPEPETPPAETSDDPRTLIEELFERARRPSHYEVLGVARTVKPDELKRVYYALARRLHPDRFRRDTDEPIRQQIDAAFAKITQAHEVLKDANLRAAYDLKLPAPGEAPGRRVAAGEGVRTERKPGDPDEPPPSPALSKESAQLARAEEAFQQGLSALQKQRAAQARQKLGEAALLAPRQARYRAYYGRALALDKATRRQAEAELQAAISLDAQNPSYRVMLAELYQEHGLRRRAASELEHALRLDPAHTAARRLLDQLRPGK